MSAETEGRTEDPTQKQREKFREEGNVARSMELNTLAQYIAGLGGLVVLGGWMVQILLENMRFCFEQMAPMARDFQPLSLLVSLSANLALAIIPLFALLWMGVFTINVAQFGWKISWKSLQPKLNKLNVVKNLKNQLFSARNLMELLKSIVKITVISLVVYRVVTPMVDEFYQFFYLTPAQIGIKIWDVIFKIWLTFILIMAVIGALDGWWQRHQLFEKMKMTPSQVKDEFKQREGDPLVKRKIRSKQFAFLQEAIRKNLDKADVIITNPTHFAVALSYAHGEMEVPKVVAKGVDHVARAIRKLARERTIPIVENRRLARSLYYQTGVDEPIPDEFFRPVAEILAFVYRLKGNPSGGKP